MNDFIEKVLNKDFKITEYPAFDNFSMAFEKNARYSLECAIVCVLAHQQLNSDKNKVKPPIENMTYEDIFMHINSEFQEIYDEIFDSSCIHEKKKQTIEKTNALKEIGDIVALLAGLVKKIVEDK